MNATKRLQVVGATASPYTQKMAALLRYRRIPYALHWGDPSRVCEELGVEKPRPVLLPKLFVAPGYIEYREPRVRRTVRD